MGNPAAEEVFAALRRVEVRLVDESQLEQWVEDRVRAPITGTPATVTAVLGQFVDDCLGRRRAGRETAGPGMSFDEGVGRLGY
jgi:hypothetical protein